MPHFSICIVIILGLALLQSSHAQDSTIDEYLNPHNSARAVVGVPPLSWDTDIAAHAQDSDSPATVAVNKWVEQNANYDHDSNSCVGGACEKYTQVVWQDSTSVGCAHRWCQYGQAIIVACNYSPPGNIAGQLPY
ncbi:hypothetical protein FEM48_Zijuj09G0186600 [Ziziphus jujuba var. spinosa]|uniref:SCP domain-containing protein n=1 Tax=Ziziphus jujuba var. spinosa TaxID=714518 RepID=A0A978UUN1_ZIZJJ|nr:hypothetical protein FEM48_Zijuj09G0186600 [Ziziphus jujuba var. spinosa]